MQKPKEATEEATKEAKIIPTDYVGTFALFIGFYSVLGTVPPATNSIVTIFAMGFFNFWVSIMIRQDRISSKLDELNK